MSNQPKILLVGLAELLDAAGAGTWSPGAAVADPGTAIVLTRLPETPEKIICLRTYDTADDPMLTEREIMVQVRCRGGQDPAEASDLANDVYEALHGLTHQVVNAVEQLHVVQIYRASEADLGPDIKGRYERSENYLVQLNSDLSRLE